MFYMFYNGVIWWMMVWNGNRTSTVQWFLLCLYWETSFIFISTKNLDISFRMFVSVNKKSILVKRLVLAAGLKRSLRSWYRGHIFWEQWTWNSSSIIGLKNGNSVMISRVPVSEHPAQIVTSVRCYFFWHVHGVPFRY